MRTKAILFILLLAGQLLAWDHYGLIRMADGRAAEGLITSRSGQLEWRQDIFEYIAENGKLDRFILKPEKKGKINLSDIKEIRKIPSDEGPSQFVTLSNNVRAKLVIKYLVIYRNDRKFYISDFITLNNYSLEIAGGNELHQVYISQIDLLRFTDPMQNNSSPTVADKKAKTHEIQSTPERPMQSVSFRTQLINTRNNSSLVTTLIMIISFLAAVSILLGIILLVRKRKRKNPNHRKPVKHIKKRR